jgi:hypothetical protein
MSQYVPASWNTGLYLNELQNEITDIGEYVGYYWSLTPNDSNITITGSSNNFNVSSPNGNNTSYAYSNLTRNNNWTITCVCQANSNMFIGIAENLSETFPGSSSPSMQMINYGVLMDTINGVNDLFPIINGVIGVAGDISTGQTLKITYDGITLKFFVDNVEVSAFEKTVSLSPIYLVVGSFFGGSIKNITFTGSGSGGGGTQNLEEVLTNGNDGGNLNITNVNNVSLNGDLSILENKNLLIGTNTNQEFKIYGSSSSPQFNLIHNDTNTLITTDILQIDQSTMTYTFGNQELANASIPTLKVQGVANDTTFEGVILDNVINPPALYINSNLVNATTKIISTGQATSILEINLDEYNLYNNFSTLLKSLSFTNTILQPNGFSVVAQFFISDTLNGTFDNSEPLNISWTVAMGTPTANITQSNTYISGIFQNAVDKLYLNVLLTTSGTATTCQMTNFNLTAFTTAEISSIQTITPTML